MMDGTWGTNRRTFLRLGVTGALVGTAGCSQEFTTSSESDETERTPPDLDRASFEFRYDTQQRQATIEFTGGAPIRGGNIQIRTDSGNQVSWAELGSTTTDVDQRLEAGSTAVLGAEIINWGDPVAPDASIRLVYTGQETPATLGRFEPTATTTLTTTVPTATTPEATAIPTSPPSDTPTETVTPTETATPTDTSTPTQTETATPTDTSTPAQTETSTPTDGTAPSISAFSLANPSDRRLRPSFDSSEPLPEIEVAIGGAEATTLTADAFSETETGDGTYRYEATYDASIDGAFTATLRRAADASGNDGAEGQSVELSVITTDAIQSADGDLAIDPPESTEDRHADFLGNVSYDGTTLAPSVSASPRLPTGDLFRFVGRDRVERVETTGVSGYRTVDNYSANDRTLRIVSSVVVDNDADSGIVSMELTNTGSEQIEINTPDSYIGQETSVVDLGFVESQQGSGDEYKFYVSDDVRRSFSEVNRWDTYDIAGSIPFVMTSNSDYSVAVGVADGPADTNLAMTENDPPTVIRIFTNRVVLDPEETVEWRLRYTGLGTGDLPADEAQSRLDTAASLSIPDDSEWEVFE